MPSRQSPLPSACSTLSSALWVSVAVWRPQTAAATTLCRASMPGASSVCLSRSIDMNLLHFCLTQLTPHPSPWILWCICHPIRLLWLHLAAYSRTLSTLYSTSLCWGKRLGLSHCLSSKKQRLPVVRQECHVYAWFDLIRLTIAWE